MDFNEVVAELRNKFSNKNLSLATSDLEYQASYAAQRCLQCFTDNGEPLKIGDALRLLGFEIWVKNFSNRNVSGVMAINADEKYPKVIGVNKKDTYEHQRFTIAHELGHYIFDVNNTSEKQVITHYYDTEVDDKKNQSEYRANKFAAALLLPEEQFRTTYAVSCKKYTEMGTRISFLSRQFDMPMTAVKRRLEELQIVK